MIHVHITEFKFERLTCLVFGFVSKKRGESKIPYTKVSNVTVDRSRIQSAYYLFVQLPFPPKSPSTLKIQTPHPNSWIDFEFQVSQFPTQMRTLPPKPNQTKNIKGIQIPRKIHNFDGREL